VSDIVIRPLRPADAEALNSLLDPDPDPFWLIQRTGRHGMSRQPDRFAVTLVAADDTGVLGAATLFENRYHPGRYPTIVEVAPHRRRAGIGRSLLAAISGYRPVPLPMAGKILDRDATATGFARAMGARTYQHCPVPIVDPSSDTIRAWAGDRAADPRIVDLGSVDRPSMVDAAVEHYEWIHERWSPMGERRHIVAIWTDQVVAADPSASRVAIVDGRIAAFCLVWPDGGEAEAVAETRIRDQRDGLNLVAACVAGSLAALDRAGIAPVRFDGHDDDPHLVPVFGTMPPTHRDPISLIEI
jgi:GNAT superfamily N-acetyltransferase